MDIFVINLAESSQRLQHMQKLFKNCDLDFERIEAINAKSLDEADIKALLEPPTLDKFKRALTVGEVACFLSHRKAWTNGIAREADWFAIFEDDIHMPPSAGAVLSSAESWLPPDADIVKLETMRSLVHVDRKSIAIENTAHCIKRLRDGHFGSAGYILSRRAAQILLEESIRLQLPLDDFVFGPHSRVFNRLRFYQTDPALCIQDQFLTSETHSIRFSSTIEDRNNRIAAEKAQDDRTWLASKSEAAMTKMRRRARKTFFQLTRATGTIERKPIPFAEDKSQK